LDFTDTVEVFLAHPIRLELESRLSVPIPQALILVVLAGPKRQGPIHCLPIQMDSRSCSLLATIKEGGTNSYFFFEHSSSSMCLGDRHLKYRSRNSCQVQLDGAGMERFFRIFQKQAYASVIKEWEQ
jgi:hypothetical protein